MINRRSHKETFLNSTNIDYSYRPQSVAIERLPPCSTCRAYVRGRVRFLDAGGNPVTARISGSLISSSPETTRAAAVAGIGLMITAPFLIEDLLASGALVPLLPGYRAQQCEINALYPHRRHLAAKVRAFVRRATALAPASQRLGFVRAEPVDCPLLARSVEPASLRRIRPMTAYVSNLSVSLLLAKLRRREPEG
jgi:LysR substrate binding domain-containing protein